MLGIRPILVLQLAVVVYADETQYTSKSLRISLIVTLGITHLCVYLFIT